jgi:hypothetical protein
MLFSINKRNISEKYSLKLELTIMKKKIHEIGDIIFANFFSIFEMHLKNFVFLYSNIHGLMVKSTIITK